MRYSELIESDDPETLEDLIDRVLALMDGYGSDEDMFWAEQRLREVRARPGGDADNHLALNQVLEVLDDWLLEHTDEGFEAEPDIDSARTLIQDYLEKRDAL